MILKIPWASLAAQMVKNLHTMQETGFDSWVRKLPWKREWQSTQYSCLENPMDTGAWRATVHGVAESDMTKQLTLSLSVLRITQQ